jgi:enoyl-CoA hydratase/carnithine racemase
MSDASLVAVTRHEHWVDIALNRPQRRNALTADLVVALHAAIVAADLDADVHVILLRGADGAFCSGIDLKEREVAGGPRFGTAWRALHERLFACETPVIGALERFGINGGAALALTCDLLVAGEGAFLQIGEAAMGMQAPMNTAWLALKYSQSVSLQLLLTARRFTGRELKALGIAVDCVPDADVLAQARALAANLASFPPGALAGLKRSLRRYDESSARTWFDRANG